MKIEQHGIRFNDGSVRTSRGGFVAISLDGSVYTQSWDSSSELVVLTPGQKMELAEAMILKWALYYSEAKNEKGTS